MTTDADGLRVAATKYRKSIERAKQIERQASADLAEAIRDAYANGAGMRKSAILRATDYVWSRTWLDSALKRSSTTTDSQ